MYRWITRLPKPIAMLYCYSGALIMLPVLVIECALTKKIFKVEFAKYCRTVRSLWSDYDYWKRWHVFREFKDSL
jgi:hypothetical protein